MTSVSTDRRFGISGTLGMKAPVRMGTTANITLSGLQTIDTVVGVAADRVLVKDQTDPIDNGIWVQATGTWTRDLDFNGTKDAITGTAMLIAEGSQAGEVWKVDTTGTINPGTSSIIFSQSFAADSVNIKNTPAGNIAATTTQAAVNELDTEKAALAGATFTGAINTALATVASHASTSAIWAASANLIDFTGTATITGFPVPPQAGAQRKLICADACTFTDNVNFDVQGGTQTVAAGDIAIIDADTSIHFKITIIKADGTSLGTSSGSFTATGVGFAGTPTATWDYVIANGICHILARTFVGTSNAITFTITGLPAACIPAETIDGVKAIMADNATYLDTSFLTIGTSGTITCRTNAAYTNWTNSGSKQFNTNGGVAQSFSYPL